MSDVLDRVRTLAKECDFSIGVTGQQLQLVHNGFHVFTGTPSECEIYLQGWRDGLDRYFRNESRGANE